MRAAAWPRDRGVCGAVTAFLAVAQLDPAGGDFPDRLAERDRFSGTEIEAALAVVQRAAVWADPVRDQGDRLGRVQISRQPSDGAHEHRIGVDRRAEVLANQQGPPVGVGQMGERDFPPPRDTVDHTIYDVISKALGLPLSTFKARRQRARRRAIPCRPSRAPRAWARGPRCAWLRAASALARLRARFRYIEQGVEPLVLEAGVLGDAGALGPVGEAGELADELGDRDRRVMAQLEQDAVLEPIEAYTNAPASACPRSTLRSGRRAPTSRHSRTPAA